VATSVGNKYIQKTKNLIYCCLISILVLTGIEEILMIVFRNYWSRLFTSDSHLITMELDVLTIFLILMVVDNMQHIFQGALKSLHYEK